MTNCTFIRNESIEFDGGAVLCTNGAAPTLTGCRFTANASRTTGGGLASIGAVPLLVDCTFDGNVSGDYDGAGGLFAGWDGSVSLSGCSFYANASPDGGGIMAYQNATVQAENTIIAFSTSGGAVRLYANASATFTCCDIYGNVGGDWTGAIADQLGLDGNIAEDPLFCDAPNGNFHLEPASPCAPYMPPNVECDLIGAHPAGCAGSGVPAAAHLALPLRVSPPVLRAMERSVISGTLPAQYDHLPLRLTIRAADGRLVRALPTIRHAGGEFRATWRGRDATGRTVPGGIYFCTLRIAGRRATARLTLVR